MSTPSSASEELSDRQREVLDFIASTIAQRGIPPSLREIGDALGISSTNGVADHVKALTKKGFLKKVGEGTGIARGLQLTAKSKPSRRESIVSVPVIGRVAAGSPILAEENYEKTFHLDRTMVPASGPVFALRVSGESMIEEGIHDGDYVIVQQQNTARNGDIVVAMVDGEATVKTFFREGSRVRLQPANARLQPFYLDAASVGAAIQGVVVGVYRVYS